MVQQGRHGLNWEVWWLNGNMPDCCPAVPGLNPVSPQPTTDCQSPGGLPPGMALGSRLTSLRGKRGENYKKLTPGSLKTYKEKKDSQHNTLMSPSWVHTLQLTLHAIQQGLQCTQILIQLFSDCER